MPDSKRKFSVSSVYRSLTRQEDDAFLANLIWIPILPTKVVFFFLMWLVYWNHFPTIDFLVSKGIQWPNKCELCQADSESADHIFLHCPKSAVVWSFFMKRFRLSWVMPRSCKDLIRMWSLGLLVSLSQKGSVVWKILPFLIWWHISTRIARIFDNEDCFPRLDKLSLVTGWVGHLPLFRDVKTFQWYLEWDSLVFQ